MFKTKDNVVRIDIAEDISEVVFPAADFSILNMPVDHEESDDIFTNLYNSPTNRHIALVFCRHKRADRMAATGNFGRDNPFTYLDNVHVFYEKASSSSNNGLLPVSEQAVIYYKGNTPDVKKTQWFASEDSGHSNATTLWNVSAQQDEPSESTYFQRFCWEVGQLLMSMSSPMEHRRFIYGFPVENDADSLFSFCRAHNLQVQLYVRTTKEATELLDLYKQSLSKESM